MNKSGNPNNYFSVYEEEESMDKSESFNKRNDEIYIEADLIRTWFRDIIQETFLAKDKKGGKVKNRKKYGRSWVYIGQNTVRVTFFDIKLNRINLSLLEKNIRNHFILKHYILKYSKKSSESLWSLSFYF